MPLPMVVGRNGDRVGNLGGGLVSGGGVLNTRTAGKKLLDRLSSCLEPAMLIGIGGVGAAVGQRPGWIIGELVLAVAFEFSDGER
jgi:hypothetical protein